MCSLDRDHERLPEMSDSLITWVAITLLTRRLARRKAQPATRRDVTPYYLAQAAWLLLHVTAGDAQFVHCMQKVPSTWDG